MNKVLISVLCKEQLFETRLYTAHVEDEHIVKRIRPLSTIDLTTVTSDTAGALDEEWLPALIRCLSIIQTKFRLLYNFRLLRDWGCVLPLRCPFCLKFSSDKYIVVIKDRGPNCFKFLIPLTILIWNTPFRGRGNCYFVRLKHKDYSA